MTGLTDTFGPAIDIGQVEDAVRTVILTWIDTYLHAIERVNNEPDRLYLRPVTDRIDDDINVLPEDAMPAIVVVSPGELDDPQDNGDGELDSMLTIVVVAAVKAADRDETRLMARRYGWAIATLLDHKAGDLNGLGQLASRPRQRLDEARAPSGRDYRGVVAVSFAVLTAPVRNRYGGPDIPIDPPPTAPPVWPDGPTVQTISVTANHLDDQEA